MAVCYCYCFAFLAGLGPVVGILMSAWSRSGPGLGLGWRGSGGKRLTRPAGTCGWPSVDTAPPTHHDLFVEFHFRYCCRSLPFFTKFFVFFSTCPFNVFSVNFFCAFLGLLLLLFIFLWSAHRNGKQCESSGLQLQLIGHAGHVGGDSSLARTSWPTGAGSWLAFSGGE